MQRNGTRTAKLTPRKNREDVAAAPKVKSTLTIPPIIFGKATFQIIGISPLVIRKKKEGVFSDNDNPKTPQKHLAPLQEALSGLYLDERGHCCMKATGIKQAMITAIGLVPKITKKNTSGLWHVIGDTVLNGEPQANYIRVYGMPTYRYDQGQTSQGGPCPMHRIEFQEWVAEITLEYLQSYISVAHIANLLKLGGYVAGCGDCRPDGRKNRGQRGGQWTICASSDEQQMWQRIKKQHLHVRVVQQDGLYAVETK